MSLHNWFMTPLLVFAKSNSSPNNLFAYNNIVFACQWFMFACLIYFYVFCLMFLSSLNWVLILIFFIFSSTCIMF